LRPSRERVAVPILLTLVLGGRVLTTRFNECTKDKLLYKMEHIIYKTQSVVENKCKERVTNITRKM